MNPTKHDIATRLARLPQEKKQGFLEALKKEGIDFSRLPIVPTGRTGWLPVSSAQLRQWFLWTLDPASDAYHLSAAIGLKGSLDAGALRAAFDALVRRHDSLRTVFRLDDDGTVLQEVREPAPVEITVVDRRELPATERAGRVEEDVRAITGLPFDLATGPLWRAGLIRAADNEHVLVVVMHHIISDAWSMQIIVREFATLYRARTEPDAAGLPPVPIRYVDYADWQRDWLAAGERDRQLAYWVRQLGPELPVLALPTDRPRRADGRYRAAVHAVELPATLVQALHDRAREQGATPFMILLAGFGLLLHRYTGQQDIRVGVPIANRHRAETQGLVGFFVNTQVVRQGVSGDLTLHQLLAQVKEAALGAQAHQDLPFEQLVDALQPERSTSVNPLFQVLFNHVQGAARELAPLPGLAVTPYAVGEPAAQFELSLELVERADGTLRAAFRYAAELFDLSTIERMASHYLAALDACAHRPDARVRTVRLHGEAEWTTLARFSRNEIAYPDAEPVHRLFERQVEARPGAIAIVSDGTRLTYGELNARANRLAHRLIRQGVGPEQVVGIAVERSVEMIVGLLAILKAGGAYLPLDPDYPGDRLAYMAGQSGVRLFLTQAHLQSRLPAGLAPELWLLDDLDDRDESGTASGNPDVAVHGETIAYVIYTSGSTGKPKGAANRHAAIANQLAWRQAAYQLGESDAVLQKTPYSFDVSVWEIFWPLTAGARLVMARPGDHRDPARIVDAIRTQHVTTVHFVPSMLQAFVAHEGIEACDSLTRVMCSGEALSAELQHDLLARLPGVRLCNLYGPTETAIEVTHWTCRADGGPRVPIGRPIASTQTCILDPDLNPTPLGVAGELYLGGVSLARGYLGRPSLTADRFVANPFETGGGRLYRTGDLVRWRADGELEYLGRLDHQVKVRGFRIELGEIEVQLLAQPDVREAVVVAHESRQGTRLVAYVSAHVQRGLDPSRLRELLARVLPDYMVPSSVIVLDALPLTPSGKIDRKALPEPARSGSSRYEAPRGETEVWLAQIWSEVLGVTQVGRDDNFFELGGDSIVSLKVLARTRQRGLTLSPWLVFEHQTLAACARAIERLRESEPAALLAPAMPRVARERPLPASFAQGRQWFLWQLDQSSTAYHISTALELQGPLDPRLVRHSFDALVERHEPLRTLFRPNADGVVEQHVQPAAPLDLPVIDLTGFHERERRVRAQAEARLLCERPFDLVNGPLLRVALIRLEAEAHMLVVAMHHIVSDDWSMRILVRDFAAAYRAAGRGVTPMLPPLAIQYADYAVWQRGWLEAGEGARQLAYWTGQLAGEPPVLRLATDRARRPDARYRAARHALTIPPALGRALHEAARAQDATLFMALLTGFQALLARYTGQEEIRVGSPFANRHRPGTDALVGCFINTVVLRGAMPGRLQLAEALRQTRTAVLDAQRHQDVPLDHVVEALQPARGPAATPLFQVVFNHLGAASTAAEPLEGITIAPFAVSEQDAKLDLTLITSEEADGTIRVNFDYAAGLFDAPTIARMARHYLALLEALATQPHQAIGDVDLLDATERTRLQAWSAGPQDATPAALVTHLIDEQIAQHPHTIAVVSEDAELTYEALDLLASALARRLVAHGVSAETIVGIAAGRSAAFVVGMLAVLRAGGAFVPLDPALPAHRLTYLVRDSGAALVVSAGGLDWDPGVPVLSVPLTAADCPADAVPAMDLGVAPAQAAYVIYTSGSTGQPKGVVISHASLAGYVHAALARLALTPEVESMAMVSTVSADLGHTVLFGALCSGRTLHLIAGERVFDPDRLAEYMDAHRIDVIKITPSHLQALLHARTPRQVLPRRRLVLGGEATSWSLLDRIASLQPDLSVINHYGPTETTVGMLTQAASSADRSAATLPIGRPLAHGAAYVLDAELNLVPPGVAGELFLGGAGVGRGYLQRSALTAQRFVADPFGPPGGRLYRTGDLVRWTAEGQIEFLGRVDRQVKIRGFRVEPAEVEALLRAQADVSDAVVTAGEAPGGGMRLVGYVAPRAGQTIDADTLRERLSGQLPDWMMPAAIIALAALPLNANGKVDRQALPSPESRAAETSEAPQGEVEALIAKVWCEVLRRPRVGRDDKFFQLGGDSIVSVRVVSRLRKAGLSVTVRQMFEHQTLRDLAAVAVPIKKPAAGAPAGDPARGNLQTFVTPEIIASLPFTAADIEDVYPLTPTQEGMFFHSNETPGAGLYVNQLSVEISHVDPVRFAAAWQAMVARHAILRTGVLWQAGVARPIQIVFQRAEASIVQLDWSQADDVPVRLAAYLKADLRREIDWLRPPLARVALIRLDAEKFQLVWTHHHLLFDGWSASRLMGEWLRHYAGETLPASPPVFGSYVRWLQTQDQPAAERFWKAELAGLDGPTLLTDAVRRNPGTPGFAKIYSHFDRAFTDRLKEIAHREGVTVNTVIQAAWTLVLQHYTARDHVVFGATVAGRPERLPGAEEMIGLFINTIPVTASRQPGATVGEYLRTLQDRALRLRDYEHSALADIQRWAGSSGRPLFDSIIVFENTPVDEAIRSLDGYGITFGRLGSEGLTGYAMDLQVVAGATVAIEYCYSRALFEETFAADLRRRMELTLSQIAADPSRRVGELQWQDDDERRALLLRGRGESLEADESSAVPQIIEERARRAGAAVALMQNDETLTYAQLDRRANRLARYLIDQGMGAETLIGVALERSVDSIVTMLAILKAGAAYVPLDPAYPMERLLFMLNDSGMSLLLMHRSVRSRFPDALPTPVVVLDDLDLSRLSDEPVDVVIHPDSLAYVIYTSGSTGTPKGVAVSHGPLARHCLAIARIYGLGPQSCELHFMSFAFDGAHERWLAPLCAGARLALRDDELWTAEKTYEALQRYRVTTAAFPPAYLEQIADWAISRDDVPPVAVYCYGGEAMPKAAYDKVRTALRPQALINGYGPTETVITPLIWKTAPHETFDASYAPIGRPVGGRFIYVLNADMQPVADGVCGELYIGGDGLARGYLGRPPLTAERFVAHPFSATGDRLYRTGDLVRWMGDGNIEYVGRTDHQVKVRGFRIELGEVEARIREVPGVLEVAVVPYQRTTVSLVAYVVPTAQGSSDALVAAVQEHLDDALPAYMVPARIIGLASLPRLVSGKLDRAALPEPAAEAGQRFVAPRDETERRLAEIWSEVLGCARVGITDNFFELGGDSILSLQVISRVRTARLGIELRLRDLLRHQTIEALMDSRTGTAPAAVGAPAVAAEGDVPLLPIQAWFFDEAIPDRHHFNQSVLLRATGPLDEERLRAAVIALERRHDGLRMRFRHGDRGTWEQRYDPAVRDVLWVETVADAQAIAAVGERAQRSLSLEDGPIWRVVLMQHADGSARLLIVIHHLVVDGVSWRILLQDLQDLYQAADTHAHDDRKGASYKAWALHLSQWAASSDLASELPHWQAQLEAIADIPRDRQPETLANRHRLTVPMRLDAERTQLLLRKAHVAYQTGVDDLLLAAVTRTIAAWSGTDAVLVTLEGHGREGDAAQLDLSQTTGWFTTMYPVRLGSGSGTVDQTIRAVGAALRSVPNKGVGYGVLRHLNADERVRRALSAVRPRVTFNYLGQFDQTFKEGAAFAPATEFAGYQRSIDGPMANWLEIVGDVYDGTLTLRWIYNGAMYDASTIERLAAGCRAQLEAIIDH